MPKLDLSRFGEQDREFILALQDVLSAQDLTRIDEHLRLAMVAPSHYPDDIHLEWPAAVALLIYGEAGVAALGTLATENRSGAYPARLALLAAASGSGDVLVSFVKPAETYLADDRYKALEERLTGAIADPRIQGKAKETVESMVRYLVSDPSELIDLGTLLTSSMLLFPGPKSGGAAMELVLTSIARSSLRISEELCERLEDLVRLELPEQAYQEFFEAHPAFLDPMASSVVEKQYLGEMFQTDFVIRRLDDEYVFVEIEKPSAKPFTGYPQASAALSHALAQVLHWLNWVEDNGAYAQSHGYPNVHSPRGLVVIGKRSQLNSRQNRLLRGLNDVFQPTILVWTFDDVITNARNVLRNLTSR